MAALVVRGLSMNFGNDYKLIFILLLIVFLGANGVDFFYGKYLDLDKGIELIIGDNRVLIPRGYFEGLDFPEKGHVDYVNLWFLLPDMKSYDKDNKKIFESWADQDDVVRVTVERSKEKTERKSCREAYDGFIIKCIAHKSGWYFQIRFSGRHKDDSEGIVEAVTSGFFKFIEI